jgi:hypothetical protein
LPGIERLRGSQHDRSWVVERRDGVVNDGAVAHNRADHSETAACRGADDLLQDLALDRDFGAERLRLIPLRRSLQFTE